MLGDDCIQGREATAAAYAAHFGRPYDPDNVPDGTHIFYAGAATCRCGLLRRDGSRSEPPPPRWTARLRHWLGLAH